VLLNKEADRSLSPWFISCCFMDVCPIWIKLSTVRI